MNIGPGHLGWDMGPWARGRGDATCGVIGPAPPRAHIGPYPSQGVLLVLYPGLFVGPISTSTPKKSSLYRTVTIFRQSFVVDPILALTSTHHKKLEIQLLRNGSCTSGHIKDTHKL